MKWLKFLCVILIFSVLAGSATPVFAQSYRFQVTDMAVVVYVNQDGSASLDYTITFQNDPGAHVIDIVDIGLPNGEYTLKTITAEVGGVSISKITASDVIYPGISLYLGSNEIPAGGSGTVHCYIPTVPKMLYPATQTTSEPYASIEFSPHYYDTANVHGNTNMQVTFVLPAGMTESEPTYFTPQGGWPGSDTPESAFTSDNRIYYTWVSSQANDYTQYIFGASFPARYVNSDAITATYVPPSTSTPGPSTSIGLFAWLGSNLCGIVFCLGFVGFFVLIIYSATVGAKKRRLQYLPPKISVEGHGIKRGLTAVEAAVLMEQPMDKIFTMTLFGVLKKNAAEVVTQDPLKLKIPSPLPADLYPYETDFLAAFADDNPAGRKTKLQTMMINLIKSIGEKMKGFSQKETVAYYDDISKKAWAQVEAANTPEVKGQAYDQNMDWTMLDKNYDTRTQQTFTGPIFIPAPIWWWRYDPTFARPMTGTSTLAGPAVSTMGAGLGGGAARPSISLPQLPGSSFAASVVKGASSFSAGVLGDLTSFTGGVTKVTNPPPPPSTYRSGGGFGGGGGHSCACACACAGCACACAGGGR